MDASQYKDYVLVLLFIKYISDKYAGQPYAPITIPPGASFKDMVALKGTGDIGDQINKKIIGPLKDANGLSACEAIAKASPRLEALVFGPGDYSAAVGIPVTAIGGVPDHYPGDHLNYVYSRLLVAGRAAGVQVIDGVTVGNNSERVLVKDQTTQSQNGIYIAANGNWVLAADWTGNNNVVTGRAEGMLSLTESVKRLLQAGKIIEDGPPNRLMRRKGPYRELVQREMSRLAA